MKLSQMITTGLLILSVNSAYATWCGYQSGLMEPADTTQYYDSAATYFKKASDNCGSEANKSSSSTFTSTTQKNKNCGIPNAVLAKTLSDWADKCSKAKGESSKSSDKSTCRVMGKLVKTDDLTSLSSRKLLSKEYQEGFVALTNGYDKREYCPMSK